MNRLSDMYCPQACMVSGNRKVMHPEIYTKKRETLSQLARGIYEKEEDFTSDFKKYILMRYVLIRGDARSEWCDQRQQRQCAHDQETRRQWSHSRCDRG